MLCIHNSSIINKWFCVWCYRKTIMKRCVQTKGARKKSSRWRTIHQNPTWQYPSPANYRLPVWILPIIHRRFVIFLSPLFFQLLQCVHRHPEKKLKNTFGWARIEVVLMLGGCVFLASLSFSLVVEAIQTLIHIDHQDPMHQPISVFIIGLVGILIHGLCYLLLGG